MKNSSQNWLSRFVLLAAVTSIFAACTHNSTKKTEGEKYLSAQGWKSLLDSVPLDNLSCRDKLICDSNTMRKIFDSIGDFGVYKAPKGAVFTSVVAGAGLIIFTFDPDTNRELQIIADNLGKFRKGVEKKKGYSVLYDFQTERATIMAGDDNDYLERKDHDFQGGYINYNCAEFVKWGKVGIQILRAKFKV